MHILLPEAEGCNCVKKIFSLAEICTRSNVPFFTDLCICRSAGKHVGRCSQRTEPGLRLDLGQCHGSETLLFDPPPPTALLHYTLPSLMKAQSETLLCPFGFIISLEEIW